MALHIIEQMEYAQKHFVETMDSLNHDETISFEDKARLVDAYKAVYPLWPHNIVQLEEKLERLNPAYQGLDKWRICGEVFWVKIGEWKRSSSAYSQSRRDSYLHAATGIMHTIDLRHLSANGRTRLIVDIDGKLARKCEQIALSECAKEGVNQLLIKIGVLI